MIKTVSWQLWWVDKQYEDGRVTVLTDEELLAVIGESCDRLGITLECE